MSLSNSELYPQFLVLCYSADSSGHLVGLVGSDLAVNRLDALVRIENFKLLRFSAGFHPAFRLYHLTRSKI